tara:strand:+ start:273 stop:518 length:246 start_codon:yes stop_codon:yes gene_type:complete
MDQQDTLEAKYKNGVNTNNIPTEDPFPRMILVCVGITVALLFVIMGFIFFDFVIDQPRQKVGPTPVVRDLGTQQGTPTPSQ